MKENSERRVPGLGGDELAQPLLPAAGGERDVWAGLLRRFRSARRRGEAAWEAYKVARDAEALGLYLRCLRRCEVIKGLLWERVEGRRA